MLEWMNPLTLFGFFLLSVKGQICLVCSVEFNLMGQTVVKRPQIFHFFSLPQSTSVADLFLVSWTDTVYIQNLFYCSLFYASYCSIILCACMSCMRMFFLVCLSVCGSLYELVSGLPESEMPYHFYTDQRFALLLLCILLILPLSIPKEISIQKYIRSDVTFGSACMHNHLFIHTRFRSTV